MNKDTTSSKQRRIATFLCERTLANIVAGGRPRAESLLGKIEHSFTVSDGKVYRLYIEACFNDPQNNDVIRVCVYSDSCSGDEISFDDLIPGDLEPVDQSKQAGLQEDLLPEGLSLFTNRGLEKDQLETRLEQLEQAMESLLGERVICAMGTAAKERDCDWSFLQRWRKGSKKRSASNPLLGAKNLEAYLPVKVWMLESRRYIKEIHADFLLEILGHGALGLMNKELLAGDIDFGVFSKENGAAALTAIADACRLPYTSPDHLETLVGSSVLEGIDPGYFAYRLEMGVLPDRQVDINADCWPNGHMEFWSYGPNAPPALVDIAQGRIPAGLQ